MKKKVRRRIKFLLKVLVVVIVMAWLYWLQDVTLIGVVFYNRGFL